MSRQQCKLCGRAVKGRRRQAAPSKKAQCGAVAVAESCHVEVLLVIARGNCVQWLVVAAQALATFEAHRRQQRLQQQRGIPGSPALRVVPEDRRLHIWEAIGAQLACKSGSAARFGRPTRHWRRQAAATVAVRRQWQCGSAPLLWAPRPISPVISHVPTRCRVPAKHNLTERCLERAPGRSQA